MQEKLGASNSDNGRNGVTFRSILLGILFTFLAAAMAHYSINKVHGSYMAIDHMPVAAISLFFILVILLHILITIVKKPLGLSSAELLVIYVMTFVGCSVTTMGFGSQILPILGAPHYYATSQNKWGELVLPHIKSWLIPQDKEAVKQFFEGLPQGASIPWMVWIKPLLCWLPFILSLYVVMICIPIIMRRQWMENERLQFPLAQVPLELIKQERRGKTLVYSLLRNKLMWLGFAIPFLVSTVNGLHHYFPIVPELKLIKGIRTFRGSQWMHFRLSFPIIGFLYLTNLDVAFSLWFFTLVSHALSGWFKITGVASLENLGIYGIPDAIFNHLGIGALIAFVLYGLWLARCHIKEVLLKAFTNNSSLDDSQELLSYRSAVLGTLFGIIFMIIWLKLSGLSLLVAFLFIVLALIIFLGITRIVIEAGIPTLVASGIAPSQIISSLGTSALSSSGLASLGFTYVYSADIRTFVMSAASNSLRIVEEIKKRRKWIFSCMIIAILVSIVTSLAIDLHLAYTHGGVNLNSWYFGGGPKAPFNWVKDKMANPTPVNASGWGYKLLGGGIMAALMFMRLRFLWWPLHPIGFAIGSVWLMQQLWISVLIAWLIKALVLRYSGPRMYRNLRPFFLGLVLGQYVVAGLWFIVDLITGHTDNMVFWI